MSPRPIARSLFLGFLAAAAVGAAPAPAAAQSLWMPRDNDHTIMLEMLRPNVESVNADFLSASFFLTGRFMLEEEIAIVGELPYVRHESTQEGTDFFGNEVIVEFSSKTVGNPYVGMEARPKSGPIFVEIGVRAPLASDEEAAGLIGFFTDAVRQDAFLPKTLSINAAFNLREVTPSKIAYRLRLNPVLSIPTDTPGSDPDLWAVYSFQIGYDGPKARVGTGMSGRALITEDFGNLGQRTQNQFELHADFLSRSIRPGLDLRVPLGDTSEVIPVALGASIAWVH